MRSEATQKVLSVCVRELEIERGTTENGWLTNQTFLFLFLFLFLIF